MGKKADLREAIYFPAIIVLLVAIVLWSAYNLLRQEEESPAFRVSVVVENSSSDRWQAFRLGLDQAASEYGVDVTFTASGDFESPADEEGLIRQELAGNPDALILDLCDSENADLLEVSTAGGRKVVYVETDGLRESSQVAAVTPSGRDLGGKLGQMILKDNPNGPRVAVLCENTARYLEEDMLKGLRESVEGAGGSLMVLDAGRELKAGLQNALREDAIAIYGDETLYEAALLLENQDKARGGLYGVGCSPSNISYLDKGVIDGMVIPDEFSMGYQSLLLLARRLSNEITEMRDVEIGAALVRSEDVHDSANEKLLFPLVQ